MAKRKAVVSKQGKKKVKLGFLRTRMWFDVVLSKFNIKSGEIPSDLTPNKIFIEQDTVSTRQYITKYFQIVELPDFISIKVFADIIRAVKLTANVKIDITIKNSPLAFDPISKTSIRLKEGWERESVNEENSEIKMKEYHRLLKSFDILSASSQKMKSRIYIAIRTANPDDLENGSQRLMNLLNMHNIKYKAINNSVHEIYAYTTAIGNIISEPIVNSKYIPNNSKTLCELLPYTQGYNDKEGLLLGISKKNGTAYLVDTSKDMRAKTCYIYASTDGGKTTVATNLLIEAKVKGYASIVLDVKGTEFTDTVTDFGGMLFGDAIDAPNHLNKFKLYATKDMVMEEAIKVFADSKASSAIELLIILNPTEEEEAYATALVEEFIDFMYSIRGVTTNYVTWHKSHDLTAKQVSLDYLKFYNPYLEEYYPEKLLKKFALNLNVYFGGNEEGLSIQEYTQKEMVDTTHIVFSLNLLSGANMRTDDIRSKLLLHNFEKLLFEYVYRNFNLGLETIAVLEESQAVSDDILRIYAKVNSLARSMRVIPVMIGNSIKALINNKNGAIALENIKLLLVGKGTKEAHKDIIEMFSLEEYAGVLSDLNDDPKFDRCFLVINKIQPEANNDIIKVQLPKLRKEGLNNGYTNIF